jgi:hypothetical protein
MGPLAIEAVGEIGAACGDTQPYAFSLTLATQISVLLPHLGQIHQGIEGTYRSLQCGQYTSDKFLQFLQFLDLSDRDSTIIDAEREWFPFCL